MIQVARGAARRILNSVARLHLKRRGEKGALISFLFHHLFRNRRESESELLSPLERITVDELRIIVEHFQERGYRFIGPDRVGNGHKLDGGKHYVMLTFDDGYYSTMRALRVLEEYSVPALFFISSSHVSGGRSFWWDVVYREGRKRGIDSDRLLTETERLKSGTHEEIEACLVDRYGHAAFTPCGDIDRPFTPDELQELARHPLVHIGNHTRDHAILTNYSKAGVREQVCECQKYLTEVCGSPPLALSYPNGNYSQEIVSVCREKGFRLGFTTIEHKNRLPLCPTERRALAVGRFLPQSSQDIVYQCEVFRSDLNLVARAKRFVHARRN